MMSVFRQFTKKQPFFAALICIPFLLDAHGRRDSRKKEPEAQQQPATADTTGIDYKAVGAPMPPLLVVYPKKAVYTTEVLRNDANLFVMIFNPTCEHCEEMAMAIQKNIDLFKKSDIVLMATSSMGAYLEYFENNTKVRHPKIKIGLDSADFISKTFLYQTLPQINIYSPQRRLLKTFSSIITIDSLKPYIQ